MTQITQLCKSRDAQKASTMSKSTMYRQIKAGTFPKPISLGNEQKKAFLASEVDAVIRARIAGKSDDEIKALVTELEAARVAM